MRNHTSDLVAAQAGVLVPQDIARHAAPLLVFLPKDEPGKDRAA